MTCISPVKYQGDLPRINWVHREDAALGCFTRDILVRFRTSLDSVWLWEGRCLARFTCLQDMALETARLGELVPWDEQRRGFLINLLVGFR